MIRSKRFPHPVAVSLAATAVLLFPAPPAQAQGFVEKAAAVGLDHDFATGLDRIGPIEPMNDWSQQGIGLGDLDGDTDLDVVAVSRMKPNHVFRNDGAQFTDVSATAQIDTTAFDNCVALGDYDNDGDLDLFVGALEHGTGPATALSRLYANDGNFVFRDVTAVSGTTGNGHTIAATWVDLDRDGLLDLYTSEFHGTANAYYRNEGNGSFTDIAAQVGLATLGSTHVTAFFDADQDGFFDVFPGQDWIVSQAAGFQPNVDDVYLHGEPDGTFSDVTPGSGISKQGPPNTGAATMGIAVGDVDYDGDLDMYETEVNTQFLMINRGWPGSGLMWVKRQNAYGVENATTNSANGVGQTVGWGAVFFDADFDPWLDLFKVNGHVSQTNPRDQQNYFFRGLGPPNFGFVDDTAAKGLDAFYDARGLAIGDVDADGDIDILTAPIAGKLRYYENQIDPLGQGWVGVRPHTTTSAPGGFGVRASWIEGNFLHVRQIGAGGGTASQSEYAAHFGLGTKPLVDLRVIFPSDVTISYNSTPANTLIEAFEPSLIELPARVLPAAKAGGGPVFGSIPGGGAKSGGQSHSVARFTVTAFAHSISGVPLDESADVTIDIPGVKAAGSVVNVRGNEFRRTFWTPSTPGRYSVQASFDDFVVGVEPTIAFSGEVDTARTTATTVPSAVRAGLGDSFEVTVVPRDAGGRLVTADVVEVDSPTGFGLTALSPVGDGRFSGVIQAPAQAGLHDIDVLVDGASLGTLATIEAAGVADPATSDFYDETPNPDIAMFPHQLKFMVTPRDAAGLRLGPGADVQIVITPDPGSVAVTDVTTTGGFIGNARSTGEFFFVMEKPVGAAGNSAFGDVTIQVEGTDLFTMPFTF